MARVYLKPPFYGIRPNTLIVSEKGIMNFYQLDEIKRKEENTMEESTMRTGVYCSCCMNCKNFDTKTEEIEVGDLVHVARMDTNDEYYAPHKHKYLGRVGTVEDISDCNGFVVRFSNKELAEYMNRCWLRLVKKAEKGFTGKVVCVESINYYFTVGKVYSVHDGVIHDNTGNPYWEGKDMQDSYRITDISKPNVSGVTFIEFKGE